MSEPEAEAGPLKARFLATRASLRPALLGIAASGVLVALLFGEATRFREPSLASTTEGFIGGTAFGAIHAAAWIALTWLVSTASPAAAADATRVEALQRQLGPALAELEAARLSTRAQIDARLAWRLPLMVALAGALWGSMQFQASARPGLSMLMTFGGVGGVIGYRWASAELAARYGTQYKTRVLPLLAAGFGDLTYRPAQAPPPDTLKDEGLFKHFDRMVAEDEIVGTYRGVPVSIIELTLTRNQGDETRTIFDGLYLTVTLPRGLRGTTLIVADHSLLGLLFDRLLKGRDPVQLEDPRFGAIYRVYGTDQIAARALLTPAFMERLIALGDRPGYQRPVGLAQDNRLTLTLPKQGLHDLFEPPDWSEPAASASKLVSLHDDIAAVLATTDAMLALDQSTRGLVPP